MALYHPDAENSEVQGVVSVRSSMPIGDPSTYDDQLITVAKFAEMKPNNHIFYPEMKTQNPVVTEILKGHPLLSNLSEAVRCLYSMFNNSGNTSNMYRQLEIITSYPGLIILQLHLASTS